MTKVGQALPPAQPPPTHTPPPRAPPLVGPRPPGRAVSPLATPPTNAPVSAPSRDRKGALSSDYVELHACSAFSFLEGAALPEDLAGACAQFGMPAMAIMDRNGVYGAPRFHMAALKAGVRAHIGSEITRTHRRADPLLLETREGYPQLLRP